MFKLVVVDDEEIVRQGLRNAVNWSEFNIQIMGEAEDGLEAFNLIKESKPEIVITDIVMPFMNGFELIKKVKEINPDTQFIIISGYEDFSYAQEAIKAGVVGYILKPTNINLLKECVKKALAYFENKSRDKMHEIYARQIIRNNLAPPIDKNFEEALFLGNKENAMEIIENLFTIADDLKVDSNLFMQYFLNDIFAIIINLLRKMSCNEEYVHNITNTFINKLYIQKSSVDSIKKWIMELFSFEIDQFIYNNAESRNKKLIINVQKYIEANLSNDISLASVGKYFNINPIYLSFLFKQETGQNFIDYITFQRVEKAKKLLKNSNLKVYEISCEVGYFDHHYFSRIFKKIVGITPSEYREKVL